MVLLHTTRIGRCRSQLPWYEDSSCCLTGYILRDISKPTFINMMKLRTFFLFILYFSCKRGFSWTFSSHHWSWVISYRSLYIYLTSNFSFCNIFPKNFRIWNWSCSHVRCSCEGLSVHISNKCHAAGLLDDPLCHAANLAFPENKIQIQEDSWCCCLCCWPCHGHFFWCSCWWPSW